MKLCSRILNPMSFINNVKTLFLNPLLYSGSSPHFNPFALVIVLFKSLPYDGITLKLLYL